MANQDMKKNELVFYDSPLSPCARRVRVTLAAKQIPHQVQYIDVSKAEQKTPAYKAINPFGKVPALTHKGQPLWESNIITLYLDEAFAGTPLYPADARGFAGVREWQAFEIRFAQSFFMLMYHRTAGTFMRVSKKDVDQLVADIKVQSDDPAFIAFNKKAYLGTLLNEQEEAGHVQVLEDSIQKIEDCLSDGRPYLIGQQFSQADISVFPRMRMLPYLGIDVSADRYPHTLRWLKLVATHPSMHASMTANEKMSANPVMLRMLRWARFRSLQPVSELSISERVRLRLMRTLFSLDTMALERVVSRIRKYLPARRRPQPAIIAPFTTAAASLALSYNPDTEEGQTSCDIIHWLGIDCRLQTDNAALPSLTLDGDVTVQGLSTIVDVLHRARPEAKKGFPVNAYARARARIWVGGDKEGETKYLKAALTSKNNSPDSLDAARNFTLQQIKQVDTTLRGNDWLAEEFGFADIATARRLQRYCEKLGSDLLEDYPRVQKWIATTELELGDLQSNSSVAQR